MKQEDIKNIVNEVWLGRLMIIKPKKNAKIGIPYKAWHHLAIIDNIVFTYVWDTREIIDAYRIGDLSTDFETIKVSDNGKALFISKNTTQRCAKQLRELMSKYKELPIIDGTERLDLKTVKETTEEMMLDIDTDNFDVHDDCKVVFVDKSAPVPENLYMFTKMPTINPHKVKYADNNAYAGMAKYFAIQARCAILKSWSELIKKEAKV
jgi:GTPase SAR1 family protein